MYRSDIGIRFAKIIFLGLSSRARERLYGKCANAIVKRADKRIVKTATGLSTKKLAGVCWQRIIINAFARYHGEHGIFCERQPSLLSISK